MEKRELDRLVAEKVLGLTVEPKGVYHDPESGDEPCHRCAGFFFEVDDPGTVEPEPDDDLIYGPCDHSEADTDLCFKEFFERYDTSKAWHWRFLPHYSEEIEDAWPLLEELHRRGWWVKVSSGQVTAKGRDPQSWQVRADYHLGNREPQGVIATADTAPLAICRAALQTVSA